MNRTVKPDAGRRYGWKTCFALMLLLVAAALYLLAPSGSVLLWVLAGALLVACPVLHFLVHRRMGRDLSHEPYEALRGHEAAPRQGLRARRGGSTGTPAGRRTAP
jgi:uncharacterized protein (DUF58 family)